MKKKSSYYMLSFLLGCLLLANAIACPITTGDQKLGGRCVNIGGHLMYIRVTGLKSPTVIFEAGGGDNSSVWNRVIPEVSKFARVVAYDRVGLGKSQPNPKKSSVTSLNVVNNLHTLLRKEKINPPYILVGHSHGGLYIQTFAEEYPKEISGMVLIDSVSRNQTFHDAAPINTRDVFDEDRAQVKEAGAFPNIPLIVLTATCHHEQKTHEVLWQKWQSQMVHLSEHGQQIIAYGSTHNIQQDQPKLVVDAIATIVKDIVELNVPACPRTKKID